MLCAPRFPTAEALEVDAFSPSISTFNYDAVTAPNIIGIRNVGTLGTRASKKTKEERKIFFKMSDSFFFLILFSVEALVPRVERRKHLKLGGHDASRALFP